MFSKMIVISSFVTFMATTPYAVLANEPVKVFSIYLKERLSFDGTLGYNKVLSYVLQDLSAQVQEQISPLPRSSKLFKFTPGSCLYPANENAWRAHKLNRMNVPLISSLPIDIVSVRAYTPKEQNKIEKKEDLYGMRVGHLIGSAAKAVLGEEDKIGYYGITSEEKLFIMLEKGRLNALLGFHPDALMTQERLGLNEAHFSNHYSVFEVSVSLLCRDTASNRRLIDSVNKRIIEARFSGKLQEYLGRHAILAP